MKLKILTVCILTTIYSFGQETILKEKKGESYYVLKDDPNIKHGTYQYSNKKSLLEKGQYDNGKKIGTWEFYDAEGNLEQKYDYSTNQLLFNKEPKQFGTYKIIVDGKPRDIIPDTLPIFIGGLSRYERFISNNLKYPGDSKSKGIEGRQFVLITLSKQGDILNASIYRPISPDIDQEALRLINELPKEWIPARYQNENVEVIVGLPVLFRLK
jgi:periplasmic protein TonB